MPVLARMSSGLSSTLVRYRPAILAITAIAAGYTVYYLHSSFWASSQTSGSRALHRSNAVHRRARHAQPSQPSSSELENRVDFTAAELMAVWHQASPDFESQSTETGPLGLTRNSLAILETQESFFPPEEAHSIRTEHEGALIRAFLCWQVPPYAFLIDPGGHTAFVHAFQELGFRSEAAISSTLTAWNLGNLDHCTERRNYYSLHDITPPTTARYVPPEAIAFSHDPNASHDHLNTTFESFFGGAERPQSIPAGGTFGEAQAQARGDMESEHSWREEDEHDDTRKEGQSLLNMLYHIAEDQSRREGYVHRQVSCNSCGTIPIRGIRYRCSNCADYDLCEQCEAMQIHTKTHLFFKIRVPAPFFDNTQRPQPVRYPGKLAGLPNHLPRHISKHLSQETATEVSEVEALWDQFKCLATVDYPGDPLGFYMAIDRDVFDKCFLPCTVSSVGVRRPPSMPIHDRIFAFFDTNNDYLIGFQEFVLGIATIRTKDKDMKLQRTFNLYDLDQDGYVSRKDFLHMHRSFYALTKDFTHDMIQNMEEEVLEGANLQENLLGTQPISSAYTGSIPPSHPRQPQEGKSRDSYGDYVISDGGGVITENDAGLGDLSEIVGDISEKEAFGDIYDPAYPDPVVPGSEIDHPLAKEPWPPHYVRNVDVDEALGEPTPILSITNIADRYKIVQVAVRRRERARNAGVERHEERKSFYEDEKSKTANFPSEGTTSQFDAGLGNLGLESRIPPPLEDDGGQEYLYQILQQSLNELLDPLFKQREDLAIEAAKTHNERQILKRQIDQFGGAGMRRLCHFQINNFELVWRVGQDRDDLGIDIEIGEEVRKLIAIQEDSDSEQYVSNLKNMLTFKVIDQQEFNLRMKRIKKPANGAVNKQNPRVDTKFIAENDSLYEFLAQKEKELGADAFTWPGWESERSGNGLVTERRPQAAAQQSTNQGQTGQSNGPAQSPSAGPSTATADNEAGEFQQVAQELSQTLDLITSTSQPLEELLAIARSVETSSPNSVLPAQKLEKEEEDVPDPTLPQNRPNSVPDPPQKKYNAAKTKQLPQFTPISPLPPRSDDEGEGEGEESCKRRRHLKYLLMMDCVEEEDRTVRNGAGRLGFREFEYIMKGPRGMKLDFLGVFYSMVNY